jgi:hypothetical protein
LELCREFGLSIDFVAAAAQDDCVKFVELPFGVTKLGRFIDSTGSERLREKIEHHRLAAEAGERDLVSLRIWQPEIGSLIANLEHFPFAPDGFCCAFLCFCL